jgi:pyrroline-5-carboxylate reductase
MEHSTLCFIGGGNMAQALIGGQLRAGRPPSSVWVVEPLDAQRAHLHSTWGVKTFPKLGLEVAQAHTVIWAVKPQSFASAAQAAAAHVSSALQLSVMAGISCASIAQLTGGVRIVRTMPNTPALIGQGITGVFANPAVKTAERAEVDALLSPMGERLWVEHENDLDAVTALSGSGPAYVFYFVEAMIQAATQMGLTPQQGRQLALSTFAGATALARASDESLEMLRQRVTSKGGTTDAAISHMEEFQLKQCIVDAVRAAQQRSVTMGKMLSEPTPPP